MTINLKKFAIAALALVCINSASAYVDPNPCRLKNNHEIHSITQLEHNKMFGLLFRSETVALGVDGFATQQDRLYVCIGRKDANDDINWYKSSTISGYKDVVWLQADAAYIGEDNEILVVFMPKNLWGHVLLYSVMGKIDDTTDEITWAEPTEITEGVGPVIGSIEGNSVEIEYETSWSLFRSTQLLQSTGTIDRASKTVAWGSSGPRVPHAIWR